MHVAQDAAGEAGAKFILFRRARLAEAEGWVCLCTVRVELVEASTVIERTVAVKTIGQATHVVVAVAAKGSAISKTGTIASLASVCALLTVRATILASLVAVSVAHR